MRTRLTQGALTLVCLLAAALAGYIAGQAKKLPAALQFASAAAALQDVPGIPVPGSNADESPHGPVKRPPLAEVLAATRTKNSPIQDSGPMAYGYRFWVTDTLLPLDLDDSGDPSNSSCQLQVVRIYGHEFAGADHLSSDLLVVTEGQDSIAASKVLWNIANVRTVMFNTADPTHTFVTAEDHDECRTYAVTHGLGLTEIAESAVPPAFLDVNADLLPEMVVSRVGYFDDQGRQVGGLLLPPNAPVQNGPPRTHPGAQQFDVLQLDGEKDRIVSWRIINFTKVEQHQLAPPASDDSDRKAR